MCACANSGIKNGVKGPDQFIFGKLPCLGLKFGEVVKRKEVVGKFIFYSEMLDKER